MNLDDDEDEEVVADELKEQEEVCLSQLEKALSQCAKCGDEKQCKMGNHVHLTFQQLCAWALSLVSFPDLPQVLYLSSDWGCKSTWSHAYITSQNQSFH